MKRKYLAILCFQVVSNIRLQRSAKFDASKLAYTQCSLLINMPFSWLALVYLHVVAFIYLIRSEFNWQEVVYEFSDRAHMCRNRNRFGLWTRTIDYRDVINKSTSLHNSRAALWNEEKLRGNPLQRISETSLEDSWQKVYAISFHCKTSKTGRWITSSMASTSCFHAIFARPFSITRSRVSFALFPVHFYHKFKLSRHLCNTKHPWVQKIQRNLQESLQ